MPAPREIFDLQVKADVGPWLDRTRRHPGIVVSQPSPAEAAFVVMPCTGTKPKFTRPCHLHLNRGIDLATSSEPSNLQHALRDVRARIDR